MQMEHSKIWIKENKPSSPFSNYNKDEIDSWPFWGRWLRIEYDDDDGNDHDEKMTGDEHDDDHNDNNFSDLKY